MKKCVSYGQKGEHIKAVWFGVYSLSWGMGHITIRLKRVREAELPDHYRNKAHQEP